LTEPATIFDWPPESNRDTVAREIDRQQLPGVQRIVLRALFDHFWPATEPAEFRPGHRMQELGLPTIASLSGLHVNTVRPAVRALIAAGYIGMADRTGRDGKPDLIGFGWDQFFGVERIAIEPVGWPSRPSCPEAAASATAEASAGGNPQPPTNANCTPTVETKRTVGVQSPTPPLQTPIVGVQTATVGVTVDPYSEPETNPLTLQDVVNLLQAENRVLRDEIQAMQTTNTHILTLLSTIATRLELPESVVIPASAAVSTPPTVGVGFRGVCTPTVPLQLETVAPSHDHEFMKDNNSLMNHDHEAGSPAKSPAARATWLAPVGNWAFPDPYFRLSIDHLKSNEHVDAIFEICCERMWWPPGEQGRLEFFALVERVLGADYPGSTLHKALTEGYSKSQWRIKQGLPKARLRLGVTPGNPPPRASPIDPKPDLARAAAIARARAMGPLPCGTPSKLGTSVQRVATACLQSPLPPGEG